MKVRISDVLIVTLLFVFLVSLPLDTLTKNYGLSTDALLGIQIGLRVIFIVYLVWEIRRFGYRIFGLENYRYLIFFIPFVIACFSNLSILFFPKEYVTYIPSWLTFFLQILFHLCTAFIEETIFRLFIHNSLQIRNRLLKILASAGIFGCLHLLNLISPNITNGTYVVSVLIQVVYTFGLGVLLGFIYEYGQSFIACVGFHFLFNLVNTVIYGSFFMTTSTGDMNVLYVCIGIGVALAIYIAAIYLSKFKKLEY